MKIWLWIPLLGSSNSYGTTGAPTHLVQLLTLVFQQICLLPQPHSRVPSRCTPPDVRGVLTRVAELEVNVQERSEAQRAGTLTPRAAWIRIPPWMFKSTTSRGANKPRQLSWIYASPLSAR